jgi:hypothetical protein
MRYVRIAIIGLTALVFAATVAQADEVTDAIKGAQGAYGSGDYKEASTQLQTALVGVNQKLIDMIIEYLPAAPGGWTAEDPEGLDASAMGAGFFASLVVSRDYFPPNGSSIEVMIAANSPLLATYHMFISNPMMAAMAGQSGMKKVSACGYDAMEQFGDGTYDLNILAGSATLISVSGDTEDDIDYIRQLANLINCKGIVSVVE